MSKKVCVIGWPISHSRSPIIHNYWLKKYKISGSYETCAVAPEQLNDFIDRFVASGLSGCNVTVPHKEAIFAHPAITIADQLTEQLSAVNTIFRDGNKLYGTNTDGYGFIKNIETQISGWSARNLRCLVLGAGGAARAITGALADAGAKEIIIANRSLERAQNLSRNLSVKNQVIDWREKNAACCGVDFLINTTSLGMAGQDALEIDISALPKQAVVTDAVYIPLETNLLRQARQNGHTVVDGLGMLLFQAVAGFEKWFGIRPEVTLQLREILVADITRQLRGHQ